MRGMVILPSNNGISKNVLVLHLFLGCVLLLFLRVRIFFRIFRSFYRFFAKDSVFLLIKPTVRFLLLLRSLLNFLQLGPSIQRLSNFRFLWWSHGFSFFISNMPIRRRLIFASLRTVGRTKFVSFVADVLRPAGSVTNFFMFIYCWLVVYRF